ncbi:MAG: hypothetical protein Q8M01_13890 [Rubrivivax sp.]|nr:hypothetical protein [Rubrivivax sp.]
MRELVLGHSAFDVNDAFSPPAKTFALAQAMLAIVGRARAAMDRGVAYAELDLMPVQRALAALRSAPAAMFDDRRRQFARSLYM